MVRSITEEAVENKALPTVKKLIVELKLPKDNVRG
jgi:hypothetical protein